MSLINPWDSKKGLKEDIKELKNLVLQHEGLLRMLLTEFDMKRRFFNEIDKASQPASANPDTDKHDSDTPSSSEKKA